MYMTYALAVLFVVTGVCIAQAPDKDAIKAKETAAWQAWKDKKADEFQKLVDKNVRGVYDDGVDNMQKHLSEMQKWDMKSFAISNFDSFSDAPDVIVTTYTVKIEGTFDGKDASGTYNSGSVWKKEGDAWMVIFHTNVKQAPAAK